MLISHCPRQLYYVWGAEFWKVRKISLKMLRAIGYDRIYASLEMLIEILLSLCKIVYPGRTGNFIYQCP